MQAFILSLRAYPWKKHLLPLYAKGDAKRFLRSYPWVHHLLTLLPLTIVLCIVSDSFSSEYETAGYFIAMRQEHPAMFIVMSIVTHLAAPISYGLYAWFLWVGVTRKNRYLTRLAIGYIVIQLIFSFLLVRFLKIAVGKPRPMSLLEGKGYDFFTFNHGNNSFPSGHTSEITATLIPLSSAMRSILLSFAIGLIIALIGFSRIYLSMHHVSDIAGGMLIGSISSMLIHYYAARGQA